MMKLSMGNISVGNRSPEDNRTWEQFLESEHSHTPLGKLLVELVDGLPKRGETWSDGFEVSAHFDGEAYLSIHGLGTHKGVVIRATDPELTVAAVEKVIHERLLEGAESMRFAMNELSNKEEELHGMSRDIYIARAKHAIEAVFPEASTACPFMERIETELYTFMERNENVVYVVRRVGEEFTGGVARIYCSDMAWYSARSKEKFIMFFKALALRFAAQKLGIPEDKLYSPKIELKDDFMSLRPLSVTLDCLEDRDNIVVKFGSDELPSEVMSAVPA